MTVSTAAYMKGFYDATKAMGDKALSSDATIEIEGYEAESLLIKQFPWPQSTIGGEIEVPTPLGGAMWQQQQQKIHQQGAVTLMETIKGHVGNMLTRMLSNGGKFNAKIYEGDSTRFYRAVRIRDAFMVLDTVDRDLENRGQILLISGTMFFHFFGETFPGNIPLSQ